MRQAAHGYDLKREVGIVRSLLERRIDGIALVGQDHDSVPMNMLARREVPVISIWNYAKNSRIPCIGADNFEAGQTVAQHLFDLGHRNISLVFADTAGNDRARDRLAGAISVFDNSGLHLSEENLHTCPYDVGEAKKLAIAILSSDHPTAIICGNDIISHGAIYACQALGLRVPEDISIVGIGDFRGSAHMEPGLTTVRLPAKRIGALAADMLVAMNETGLEPQHSHRKVDLSFIQRGSTAAAST